MTRMKKVGALFAVSFSIVAALLTTPTAYATEGEAVETAHVTATLVSDAEAIQPGIPFRVALRLVMDTDWHTYWINPGDAGLATTIKWELPEGFTASELQWPIPERIGDEAEMTYAYNDTVYLIAEITPRTEIRVADITINATATWLVCKEKCLPGKASLTLTIPVAPAPEYSPTLRSLLNAVQATVPVVSETLVMSAQRVGNRLLLTVGSASNAPIPNPEDLYFFVSDEGTVQHAAEQKVSKRDGMLVISLWVSEYAYAPISALRGVLFSRTGWGENAKTSGVIVNVPIGGAPEG